MYKDVICMTIMTQRIEEGREPSSLAFLYAVHSKSV